MKIDTEGFTDKASKNPDELRLYKEADNYIEAYSKHTDLRVRRDGHAQAIGGQWEEHGPMQLEFLKKQGLTPDSTLLDFGCGTGRLARHAVPYLATGRYLGIDISKGAVAYAVDLAESEKWAGRNMGFRGTEDGFVPEEVLGQRFDVIWMHSVFTHLPEDIIEKITEQISNMDFGVWCFTFKRREYPMRTGLKQFGYPAKFFIDLCARYGLKAEDINHTWPQGQSCIRVVRG